MKHAKWLLNRRKVGDEVAIKCEIQLVQQPES